MIYNIFRPKRRKLLLQPSTPKPARRRRLPSEVKIVYSNLESCVQQAVSSSLSSAGDAFRRKKFRFKIVDFPTGLLRGYFCARDDCSSALKDTWQDGTYCCWNGHQGDQCAADWDTRDLLVTDVVSDTDAMVSFNVKSAKALWEITSILAPWMKQLNKNGATAKLAKSSHVVYIFALSQRPSMLKTHPMNKLIIPITLKY